MTKHSQQLHVACELDHTFVVILTCCCTMQVWSEPSMVEAGAYEFADTAKFLAAGQAWLPHTCHGSLSAL